MKLLHMKEKIKTTIHNCARCGQNHKDLEFNSFENAVEDTDGTVWDYWALCPINGEPILLKVTKTDEVDA